MDLNKRFPLVWFKNIKFSIFNITVPLTRLYRIYDSYDLIACGSDVTLAQSNYGFTVKGVVGSVVPGTESSAGELIPIYRMYSNGTTAKEDHLFTNSLSEVNLAVNTFAFRYEGVRFICANAVNALNATVPLYRSWTGTRHFYTTNVEEVNSVVAAGGKNEGVLCYIWP